MKQSALLTGLVCVLTSLASAAPVDAQTPAPLETHLFIVYALDDLGTRVST
jgi:hypothetical protein